VLELAGAGITGGYLALKIKRPETSYSKFLQLYIPLGVDFMNRLEASFVEAMVPEIEEKDRQQLTSLLDRGATFQEKLRFFQQRVPAFDEMALKALERFEQSRQSGVLGQALRKQLAQFRDQAADVAVDRLSLELQESFLLSMWANVPSDRLAELELFLERNTSSSLLKKLRFCQETFPKFGSLLFDAISRFENKIFEVPRA
jgi:hypothetical protein